MAAVDPVTKARNITPPAYEFNQDGAQASVDLTAGQLVTPVATTPSSGFLFVVAPLPTADAGSDKKRYVVLRDSKAGRIAEIGSHAELDGYADLTPGAPLYPSGAVAGGIDGVATGTPVARMWAVSTSRIYFNL